MEIAAKSNSKRMYSWWWDSHNTPKNSKWLQDNLADMDSNVKQMIKVLEEDADSFARRAEMYYRKRPELMKLVEEFYRAYRALAERYNHATGVIHKAHETIAEAFPNQVPLIFGDESHGGALTNDVDPQTPDMPPPFRARGNPDEFQQDALGFSLSHVHDVKRNIDFSEEPLFVSNGKARKGLNFNDHGDGKGRNGLKDHILSESERASKAEAEVVALKDSLSKMQAEKQASLALFEKNLERLSNLESEVSRAQADSRGINDRAASAEAEIQTLRETLYKLESEKESSFLQYHKCLQKIADLEDGLSVAHKEAGERASKAETETLALKRSLAKAETDKETALIQYRQCLNTISNLEERLRKAEEDARLINERAEKAGVEVENLKQTVSKLIKDKEASELQFQQCLNIIASLKVKLHHAQEETQSLSHEIEDGVAKLKFSEEKCLLLERSNQNLHSELDSLLEKLGNQSQKLTEKQTELVKLWSCVQAEHLHFQEAETAFQTLQQLHSQSQEELNNLAVELQTVSQIMKDMEMRNNELHEELEQAKVENKGLNDLNFTMEKLVQKNLMLEKSISYLNSELESFRRKLKTFEEACQSLSEEKSCLISENQHNVIENTVLIEWLRQLRLEAVGIATEKTDLEGKAKTIGDKLTDAETENLQLKRNLLSIRSEKHHLEDEITNVKDQLHEKEKEFEEIKMEKEKLIQEVFKERKQVELWESQAATFFCDKQISVVHETLIEATTRELAEACKNLESKSASRDADIEKLKRSQTIVLLNESIKSLEDYVFTHRESAGEVSKGADLMDEFLKLEGMCLRIKAIAEAIMEKEKFLMLENTNTYSMLEASLKQIKELKTGGGRSMRKQDGGSGRMRKQSHETEMVMKDIVLDQTSDGSSYEIVSKKGNSELDHLGFVELKPVKTHKTETKALSEESLIVEKVEIFDGFMDPNREVNKRRVLERLDSDLQKLENLQITVEDLKSKVETVEKEKTKVGENEYKTIKGQLEEGEEAIEKLFTVNRKLTTKAESEKDIDRRRRIFEHARRGTEKIGRLQSEIQRIQFLLMKLEGEREHRLRSKISDTKVLLRDYIYGRTRSVSMKKRTKKRDRKSVV